MTLESFQELLESTDMPVTYREWEEEDEPELPYIVYYVTDSVTFHADNKRYWSQVDISVELYTGFKEPDNEKVLEALFDDNDLLYEKQEYYWEDDNLHENLYSLQIHF